MQREGRSCPGFTKAVGVLHDQGGQWPTQHCVQFLRFQCCPSLRSLILERTSCPSWMPVILCPGQDSRDNQSSFLTLTLATCLGILFRRPKQLPCQNGSEIISHDSVCIPPWRKGLTVELSAASQHINPFSIAITKYLGLGNRAWSHPHSRSGKGLLAVGFTKARMFGEIRNQSCSVSSGQLTPSGTNQGPRKAL